VLYSDFYVTKIGNWFGQTEINYDILFT